MAARVVGLAAGSVSRSATGLLEEVWPCKVTGLDLDRMASENTIENIEFSVGTCGKIESRKRLLQFRIFYMYVFVYQWL